MSQVIAPAASSSATETKDAIMSLDDAPVDSEMVWFVAKEGMPAFADKKATEKESLDKVDDKHKFKLTKKAAVLSNLPATALEGDKEAKVVPLPSVTAAILKHVVDFLVYHDGDAGKELEKPLKSKEMKDVVDPKFPEDAKRIDAIGEDRQTLYDLILAANFMDIKPLLYQGCAKVASLIKGQPLEKIKAILSKGIDPAKLEANRKAKEEMDRAAAASKEKKEEKKE